ncbi:helix-turn-helix domain-containing protein [Algihabitans sp.]|uniref:helix-turn-helix domain-containing protein n=1 Tax=Algihabitans sp. TaxID=2821514 RepID=UPI003BA8DB5F
MGIRYGQLSLEERLAISDLHGGGRSIRSIAATLRQAPSTISRQPRVGPQQPADQSLAWRV